MSQPRRRFLKRLGLVLLILVVLGVALFTWLAWWPLEGSVDQMVALVPADVDFVLRGSWKGIKETGWLQENIVEHPVVPELEEQLASVQQLLKERGSASDVA